MLAVVVRRAIEQIVPAVFRLDEGSERFGDVGVNILRASGNSSAQHQGC